MVVCKAEVTMEFVSKDDKQMSENLKKKTNKKNKNDHIAKHE